MRVISNLEKKIIDRICEGHTQISVLLTDQIPDILLSINRDSGNIGLFFQKQLTEDQIAERAALQTERIIYIYKFVQYLENEGYALTGFFAHGRSVNPTIGLQSVLQAYSSNPSDYSYWQFTDDRMSRFIFGFSDLIIFPTHQLKAFKQNNYRTREDIRHNQIIWITIIAVIVSLILGLAGLLLNKNSSPTYYRHHHCNCRAH